VPSRGRHQFPSAHLMILPFRFTCGPEMAEGKDAPSRLCCYTLWRGETPKNTKKKKSCADQCDFVSSRREYHIVVLGAGTYHILLVYFHSRHILSCLQPHPLLPHRFLPSLGESGNPFKLTCGLHDRRGWQKLSHSPVRAKCLDRKLRPDHRRFLPETRQCGWPTDHAGNVSLFLL